MNPIQFGLRSQTVQPKAVQQPHHHNDIEINFIADGELVYLYHGQFVTLHAGDLMVFWASLPHRVTQASDNVIMHWLTIPLAQFLSWGLDSSLEHAILEGKPIIESGDNDQSPIDQVIFQRWQSDLRMPSTERNRIVLLEVHARLRRLSLAIQQPASSLNVTTNISSSLAKAQQMAHYISRHYQEPLTIQQVAQVAGLNTSYASTIFREHLNLTIWETLTQYRLAHAQRLFATTQLSIPQIAKEAGFTSQSQFYALFKRFIGQTPRQYAISVRHG